MKTFIQSALGAVLLFTTVSLPYPASGRDSKQEARLDWWREAKFGMFIHWGLYSEAGGVWKGRQVDDLGEQIQRFAKIPKAEYEELAPRFNPVAFDPDAWVALAKSAGMRYIVITTKHHDGFCMFNSKLSDFTITKATPFKRDPIKLLSEACARVGIGFGVYFSNIDWHFPGAVPQDFNHLSVFDTISEAHNRYNLGQIEELLTGYGPLVEVFFDMGKPKLEQSIEWATLVHKLQPNCLVNGRVMNNQGDFLTMPDNKVPEVAIPQAWEAPSTLYHWSEKEIPGWNNAKMDTWGYKSGIIRPDLKVQVAKQIRKMVSVISRGGNFVLNVGPNGKGEIIPYEQDVLKTMGAWVEAHQEALFGTAHDPFKKLEWGHCTVKGKTLYFFVVNWPKERLLRIPGLKSEIKSAELLTEKGSPLAYSKAGDDLIVTLPANAPDDVCPVVAVELGSELAIVNPLVKPDKQGQITLTRKDAIAYGHYDGMQYTSLNPNVRYGWDFSTSRAGDYSVKVSAVGVTGILRINVGDQNVELKPVSVDVITIHLPRNERLTLSLSGENPKQTIQGKIESVTLAPL